MVWTLPCLAEEVLGTDGGDSLRWGGVNPRARQSRGNQISMKYQAPPDVQRLIFDGNELGNDYTIDDCNINAENTIYVSMPFSAAGDGRPNRTRKHLSRFSFPDTHTVEATGEARGAHGEIKLKPRECKFKIWFTSL